MKDQIIKYLESVGFVNLYHLGEELLVIRVDRLTLSYSKTNNYFELNITEENSDLNIDIAEFNATYWIHELSLDRIKSIVFGLTGITEL